MNTRTLILYILLALIPVYSFGQSKLSAQDYYIEALRHFLSGDMKKADLLLDKCIKEDNRHDAAYYYKAMVCLNKSEVDNTIRYLSKARSLSPDNDWYTTTLARLYALSNEMEMAIKLYEELIAKHPNKSSNYYEIIELYGSAEQYSKALEVLDKIEMIRGGADKNIADLKYDLLIYNGQQEQANEFLQNYFNENPSAHYAFLLGDVQLSSYKDSTALSLFEQALELDPDYTPAYYGIAQVALMRADYNEFFKNIETFTSDPDVNTMLKLDIITREILSPEMIRAFKPKVDTLISNLESAHPSDTTVISFCANYNIAVGETERGIELLKKNIEVNPESFLANYDYLRQMYSISKFEEVITQGAEVAKRFPNNENILEIIAISHWQLEQIEEAVNIYKTILGFLPKDHPMRKYCYSSLGDLYFKLDQSKTAFKFYEEALKIDENFISTLNNYAYYLSLEGKKLKKALEMSKKTIDAEPNNSTYLDTYGWILHLLGQNEEAKKYIKQAIVNGGKGSAAVIDHYGDILFDLGEYDLAFLYWSDAHKMDPTLGIDKKISEKRKELSK